MRACFLALSAVSVFLAGCDQVLDGAWNRVQEDFHYSYPLSAGGKIEVENQNGPIDISGWDQNTVDISGTKYANRPERLRDLRVEVSNTPNSVSLRTIPPSDHWGNAGVRYSIRVPRRAELDRIVTSNGPISVDSIDGSARLHTSNGRIRGSGITGALDAETSNGQVALTDLGGPATVHTSNGAVELTFDTVHEVRAGTSNGTITLRLPAGAGASIHARTSNGAISSDFDVTAHGLLSKHSLEGMIGPGGPLLDLSTSNGAIRILKR
jgi:Putative adhesin